MYFACPIVQHLPPQEKLVHVMLRNGGQHFCECLHPFSLYIRQLAVWRLVENVVLMTEDVWFFNQ